MQHFVKCVSVGSGYWIYPYIVRPAGVIFTDRKFISPLLVLTLYARLLAQGWSYGVPPLGKSPGGGGGGGLSSLTSIPSHNRNCQSDLESHLVYSRASPKIGRVRTICIAGSTACGCTCDITRENVASQIYSCDGREVQRTHRWSQIGLSSLVRETRPNIMVITRCVVLSGVRLPTYRPLYR